MRTAKFPEWHQSQGNWAARRNDDMAQLVTVLLRKPHATQSYSLSKVQAYSLLLCFVSFLVRAFGHAVFDVSGKPKLLAEKLLGVKRKLHGVICPIIHQEGTVLVFAMFSTSTRALPGQLA